MKKIIYLIILFLFAYACKKESKLEQTILKIPVEFDVERFDLAFAKSTPEQLTKLKEAFPFMFSKRIPDSIWVAKLKDTLQNQLNDEVESAFKDFKTTKTEITSLFQHIKYYDKTFKAPRLITYTDYVDYRNKVIVTDTIALLALDTYLGSDHEFYSGIQQFITQNMRPSQIVCDMATEYAERYVYQSKRKTLLDDMIYFGKQLYFKDAVIPFKTDAEKIGYTTDQFQFAVDNESYIWRYFIEKEMLYSTDTSLSTRFIAPAPFSKFYLELDNDSPGRLGQYIGWQIVRAYMQNNDVALMDMLQKDATEIFNNSKFKPKR